MTRLISSMPTKLDDPSLERVRRNLDDRISELQTLPLASARVISSISLPDATDVPIVHGLGRKPLCILVSPPRDASTTGLVTEVRGSSYSRDQFVVLHASGFGATITVDLVVV